MLIKFKKLISFVIKLGNHLKWMKATIIMVVGKGKKSNLSINHKLKTYHLESSQSSSNSSQILDDSSSSSDLDECNSLNISSSQTTESNILHEGATDNEFGM